MFYFFLSVFLPSPILSFAFCVILYLHFLLSSLEREILKGSVSPLGVLNPNEVAFSQLREHFFLGISSLLWWIQLWFTRDSLRRNRDGCVLAKISAEMSSCGQKQLKYVAIRRVV